MSSITVGKFAIQSTTRFQGFEKSVIERGGVPAIKLLRERMREGFWRVVENPDDFFYHFRVRPN